MSTQDETNLREYSRQSHLTKQLVKISQEQNKIETVLLLESIQYNTNLM